MLSSSQMEQVRKFAEDIASREGCVLYDIEYLEGPARSLRVYIDKTVGGVSIEDCANVSRGLNLRLDVEDAIPGGRYDLEVSSPGLDRKLTQLWHFEKAVGSTVQVRYADAQGKVLSQEGKLIEVVGTQLNFENKKGPWNVDFARVQRARIQLVDLLNKKPPPGQKKR